MVVIREHNSQHDDPDALPLLTESARVAEVTPLDADRTDEVRRAAGELLDHVDHTELRSETDPPDIDWEGVDDLVEDGGSRRAMTKLSHLASRYRRPYPSLLSLKLHEVEEPIDFVPGQYVTLQFHQTPRAYSLASSPNRTYLECCIRRVPGGRLTPDLFEDLEEGDEVSVRGPNGDFVLADPSPRDMVFLATGTGVAPLKSMIEYTFETGHDSYEGEDRDVWLFLGASWKDDLAYYDRFRELEDEHDNFHFVPALSRERYLTRWHGETAYVQNTLMKYLVDDLDADISGDVGDFVGKEPDTDVEARIDPSNAEVYACGVTAMVTTLVDVVTQAGIPEDLVRAEGYG